jgi:hypothetical protein
MGAAGTKAAQLVGADPEAQGIVRRRRPAEGGGAAPRRDPEVLESDLEPETVCRPAKIIFVLGIRVEESPATGPSRPARRIAKHVSRQLFTIADLRFAIKKTFEDFAVKIRGSVFGHWFPFVCIRVHPWLKTPRSLRSLRLIDFALNWTFKFRLIE